MRITGKQGVEITEEARVAAYTRQGLSLGTVVAIDKGEVQVQFDGYRFTDLMPPYALEVLTEEREEQYRQDLAEQD